MQFSDLLQNHRSFQSKSEKAQYNFLANGQKPIAMLVTCVDSRIMPEQILGLTAGQLFVLRNIAGLVQPEGQDYATESAIEYAATALAIKHIIVMSHTNCGGINALINESSTGSISKWLEPWLNPAKQWLKTTHSTPDQHCQQQATLASAANIRNMSFINEDINIYSWHFHIASAKIYHHNAQTSCFSPI